VSETPRIVLQPLGDPGLVCEGDACELPSSVVE
jgi:hypothetical protein